MNPGPGPPIQPYRLRVHDRQPPAHQPNGRHRTDPQHSLTMAHPPVAPTSSVSLASQALRPVGTGENCCHFEFYFIRTPTRARSHCPCLFVTSAPTLVVTKQARRLVLLSLRSPRRRAPHPGIRTLPLRTARAEKPQQRLQSRAPTWAGQEYRTLPLPFPAAPPPQDPSTPLTLISAPRGAGGRAALLGRPRWRKWRRGAPSASQQGAAATRRTLRRWRRLCGGAARWTRRRRSSQCARPSTCSAAGRPPSPSGATRRLRRASTSAQRSVNRSAGAFCLRL